MSENRQDESPSGLKPYGNLDAEELDDLIESVFYEDEIDFELLDKLLNVQTKHGESPDADVDAAWERFKLHHAGQGEIYLTDNAENTTQTNRISKHKSKQRVKTRRKSVLRLGYVAAVLVICLSVVTLLTTPAGASVRKAVANWTNEVFGFGLPSDAGQISAELEILHETLAEHGITEKLAPTWIPDGFTLLEVSSTSNTNWFTISAFLAKNSYDLVIQVVSLSEPSAFVYEKDDGDVTKYTHSGVDYFIMSDMERIQVVWTVDNYECFFAGHISEDEAIRMIDSIYER